VKTLIASIARATGLDQIQGLTTDLSISGKQFERNKQGLGNA
jgi:hypothetical protein